MPGFDDLIAVDILLLGGVKVNGLVSANRLFNEAILSLEVKQAHVSIDDLWVHKNQSCLLNRCHVTLCTILDSEDKVNQLRNPPVRS